METVIEVATAGEFWHLTRDGEVVVRALTREGAITAAARLLRRPLKDPAAAGVRCVGLELSELLAVPPADPNRRRKGPRIEIELFDQAEEYLQTELIPGDDAELLAAYRAAVDRHVFHEALELLAQLGERQDCSNPFWRILERLAEAAWPTQWMMDRRAKGERETKIAAIRQRARGGARPDNRR